MPSTTTIRSIQRCQGRRLLSATKTHFFLSVFLLALFAVAADSALSNDGGPKPPPKLHPLPLPPASFDDSAARTIKNGSSNLFPAGKPSAALNLNGYGGGGSTKVISAAITAGNRARQQQTTSIGINDTFKVQELHPLPPPPPASAVSSSSSTSKNDSSAAPTIGNDSSKLKRSNQFPEHIAMESLGLSQPLPLPERGSAKNQPIKTSAPISGGIKLPPPPPPQTNLSFQAVNNNSANGTIRSGVRSAHTFIESMNKKNSSVSTKQPAYLLNRSQPFPESAININNSKNNDFLASSSNNTFKRIPANNAHQPQALPKPPGSPSLNLLIKSTAGKSSQQQKNIPSSPPLTFHTRNVLTN